MTTATREFITRKNRKIITTLTDEEAIAGIKVSKKQFAADLVAKLRKYGQLTTDQLAYAHAITMEDRGLVQSPSAVVGLSSIIEMFDAAAVNIKFPSVKFEFEELYIRLYRSGERAKEPGSVAVVSNTLGGWIGRVDRDGKFFAGKKCTDQAAEFIKAFATDPAGIAASYGKSMGRCCFCHIELSDDRSLEVGYGPQCAKNYRLPWGGRK